MNRLHHAATYGRKFPAGTVSLPPSSHTPKQPSIIATPHMDKAPRESPAIYGQSRPSSLIITFPWSFTRSVRPEIQQIRTLERPITAKPYRRNQPPGPGLAGEPVITWFNHKPQREPQARDLDRSFYTRLFVASATEPFGSCYYQVFPGYSGTDCEPETGQE